MAKLSIFTVVVVMLVPLVSNAETLMYVPTGEANDLVVIDLKSNKVVQRIPELENAHGLASSPGSEYLIAGSMQPLGASGNATKPMAVSESEHAAHHAAGSKESAPSTPSYVSIVHPKHGHVMRRIAVRGLTHHTAVSPDGKYAVAVHPGSGGVSIIDLKSMSVVKEIATGRSANYGIFSNDGKHLYVSNAFSGTVSDIDSHSWTVNRSFNVGKEPEHLALSSDNAKLFIANVGEGAAVEIDLASGKVANHFSVGKEPHGIDVSKDGKWLFVSSKGEGKLVRIDLQSGKQSAIELKPAPYHLTYVDSLKKLYVSSRKEPKIWVIDPASLSVTSEIAIGKGVAHQMVLVQ